MDTEKQDHKPGHQESDDLIAELARLVAQDARPSQSPAAPLASRVEPALELTAPTLSTQPEQSAASQRSDWAPTVSGEGRYSQQGSGQTERREPAFGSSAPDTEANASVPEFDFGLVEQPEAQPQDASLAQWQQDDQSEGGMPSSGEDMDPIAALIAHAEDIRQPESDSFDDLPIDEAALVPEPAPYEQAPAEPYEPYEDFAHQKQARDRDPLSEIEALIGEAARVSTAAGIAGERKVRSSFLGEDDTNQPISPTSVETADEQAGYQQVDPGSQPVSPEPDTAGEQYSGTYDFAAYSDAPTANTAPPEADHAYADPSNDLDYESEEPEPVKRRRGGIAAIAVPVLLGGLIFAGIGGAYFAFFAGDPDPADAPVLSASGDPIRIEPEPVTNTTTASQSIVFNELDGGSLGEEEVLVSRDQTDGADANTISQIMSSEDGSAGLANRPVRTVTVRPDGTIVASEDSMAGGSVLPVDRPDVPSVGESAVADDPIGQAIMTAMGTEPSAPLAAPSDAPADITATDTPSALTAPAAGAQPSAILDPVAEEPAALTTEDTTAEAAGDDETPRPIPRPQGLSQAPATATTAPAPAALETEGITSGVAVLEEPAATPAVDAAPPAAPTASAPIGAWVQLSSQRSEDVARAGMAELQQRYGSLFNGGELEVSRVDLGERGIYYRVRLGQPTMAQASSVCQAIQGQGGDCFVLNN